MLNARRIHVLAAALPFTLCLACAGSPPASEPSTCRELPNPNTTSGASLSSWSPATRGRIEDFVKATTTPSSPDFVAPEERIAVFDNDGTLWSEQPLYVQLVYTLDRVRELAPAHPDWPSREPFASVIADDDPGLVAKLDAHALVELILASHSGVSTDEYQSDVRDWLGQNLHPRWKRPYTQLVYQPMLELLDYLRAHDFKTFIVSGGGIDFMRVFAEDVYGIPPEQVIGTSVETKFRAEGDELSIEKEGKLFFLDDGPGKPVAIQRHIGRRPIFAAGNSDGDFEMLRWTSANDAPSFSMLVHHTDGEREAAYDRKSPIGKLDKALDHAATAGWLVVDMKRDWNEVFAMPDPTTH